MTMSTLIPMKVVNPKGEEFIKDLEFINLENTKLKESIAILDKGLTGVIKGFDAIKEALKDQEKRISIQLTQLERKFDDKLEVYNEELKQEFKRDIVSTRNSMKDKLYVAEETLKKRIATLEELKSDDNAELIDQQIRKMVNIADVNEMIKSIEIRVSDVENHLTKGDQNYQTLNQSSIIETLQKKVLNQSEQLAAQANTIQILQEKVKRMEMVKIDNNDRSNQYMRKRIMEPPQGADAHDPMENTLQTPDNSQNTSSQYSTNKSDKRINKVANSLLVLMDSNRQHIEKDKLWRDCEIVKCNRLQEATKIISKLTEAPRAILVHAGVNDIEHQSPQEVFSEIVTLIDTQKHALPNTHLILSEIIPRMDALDRDVIQVNDMIRELNDEKITIVKHHSLRYYERYRDNKHVNDSTGVIKLAGNLKAAIRSAFGIAKSSKPRTPTQWGTNSNSNPNQWYNDSVVHGHGAPRPSFQHSVSPNMPNQSAGNGEQSLKKISQQLEMLIPLMCGRIQMPVAPVAPNLYSQQVR